MSLSKTIAKLMIVFCIVVLCGCGGSTGTGNNTSTNSDPSATYTPAYGILLSSFNSDAASGDSGVLVDTSNISNGYVGITAVNDSKLKLQVVIGDLKMNYDLDNTGIPLIINMQSGDGDYILRVMQNTVDDKYFELYSTTVTASLIDPLLPFLYSSTMVSFTAESACVKKAEELRNQSSDEITFISKVYDYLKNTISYDSAFAQSNPKAYVSDPDSTLSTQKGICFDYATLAAAMMRSQGVPCKLITGYVGEESIYHAWNSFYTQEGGWVTVSIDAPKDEWSRIDITYASTGEENPSDTYTDRYIY